MWRPRKTGVSEVDLLKTDRFNTVMMDVKKVLNSKEDQTFRQLSILEKANGERCTTEKTAHYR